jgi:DNA-binding beta-propeller fold protein YncE
MKSQPDVTERLKAAGYRIPVGDPPIDRIVHHGRRRIVGKVISSSLLVAVLGGALVWSGRGLLFARSEELRLGDGTAIPKPHVVKEIPLSGIPWGVAFDGKDLWVASYFDNLISKVDPKSNSEVEVIPVPGRAPYNIVADGEALWTDGYPAILRIDPHTGGVTELPELSRGHGYPSGMAVGAGSLWIGYSQDREVLRVDPATKQVVATIQLGISTEAAFGEGSVWVGGCADDEETEAPIWRIDPLTNTVVDTILVPPAGGCAFLPAVGDGAVFVFAAGYNEIPRMWKIDAATGRVVAAPLPIRVAGLPVVYRGVVWIVTRADQTSDDAFLTLVDATTMEVIGRPIPVGQFARRVAQGDGSIWVPSVENGRPTLFRITP